jgi:hypothetical protein
VAVGVVWLWDFGRTVKHVTRRLGEDLRVTLKRLRGSAQDVADLEALGPES